MCCVTQDTGLSPSHCPQGQAPAKSPLGLCCGGVPDRPWAEQGTEGLSLRESQPHSWGLTKDFRNTPCPACQGLSHMCCGLCPRRTSENLIHRNHTEGCPPRHGLPEVTGALGVSRVQAGEQTPESRRLLGPRVTAAPPPPPGAGPLSSRRAQVMKLVLPPAASGPPLRADLGRVGFCNGESLPEHRPVLHGGAKVAPAGSALDQGEQELERRVLGTGAAQNLTGGLGSP